MTETFITPAVVYRSSSSTLTFSEEEASVRRSLWWADLLHEALHIVEGLFLSRISWKGGVDIACDNHHSMVVVNPITAPTSDVAGRHPSLGRSALLLPSVGRGKLGVRGRLRALQPGVEV